MSDEDALALMAKLFDRPASTRPFMGNPHGDPGQAGNRQTGRAAMGLYVHSPGESRPAQKEPIFVSP